MKRSEMREQAFLLTFEGLFSSGQDIDEVIELYSENVETVSKYAKDVFVGVKGSKNELDEIISIQKVGKPQGFLRLRLLFFTLRFMR